MICIHILQRFKSIPLATIVILLIPIVSDHIASDPISTHLLQVLSKRFCRQHYQRSPSFTLTVYSKHACERFTVLLFTQFDARGIDASCLAMVSTTTSFP